MIGSSTAMPSARIFRSPLRASADIELSLQTPPARLSRASSAGRELDVVGQLVLGRRNAIARFAKIVRVEAVADRLDRHAEATKVLFVALEHLLERVLLGARFALLAVPGDGGEDRVLRQPLLGRHEGDDEVDEPLLRRVAGRGFGGHSLILGSPRRAEPQPVGA